MNKYKNETENIDLNYERNKNRDEIINCVKSMIKNGVDINIKNYEGNTPILIAITSGSNCIVKLLLDYGADITIKNNKGFTPFQLYIQNAKEDIIQNFISAGENIDSRDDAGNTLLHFAVKGDNVTMVITLLNLGVDIFAKNLSGQTSRDLAISLGNKETEMILNNWEKKLGKSSTKDFPISQDKSFIINETFAGKISKDVIKTLNYYEYDSNISDLENWNKARDYYDFDIFMPPNTPDSIIMKANRHKLLGKLFIRVDNESESSINKWNKLGILIYEWIGNTTNQNKFNEILESVQKKGEKSESYKLFISELVKFIDLGKFNYLAF